MIVDNDKGIINNNIDNDDNCVKSGIPQIVNIDISQTTLSKDPYAKFKFPRVDPELCEAGKIEVSTLDSLGYLINLFCHRLDPDLKEIWDGIAGRDVATPEISSCGMLTTIYDIRKHCADFKKARDKENYVKNLNDKFSQGNVDLFTSELLKNVPRFRTPVRGVLFDFLSNYDTTQKILRKLELLINEMQFNYLWDLFNQIQACMIFKKERKKIQKFCQFLKQNKTVHKFKQNYYLRFISRTITLSEKFGNIRIESLHSTTTDKFTIADCPEILISLGNTDILQSALVDSGAQTSICPMFIFESLGLDTSMIQKVSHHMSLVGTTGHFDNAIVGTFTIPIYCLLKKYEGDNNRVFGKSKITFLITKKEVQLKRIILGILWQKATKLVLSMDNPIKASARLVFEGAERRCSLELKNTNKVWIESVDKLTMADTKAIFYLNSIFLENSISLKLNKHNNNIILPNCINLKNNIEISRVRNFPIIQNASLIELPVKVTADARKRVKISLTVSNPELPLCNESTSTPHLVSENPVLDSGQHSERMLSGIADVYNHEMVDDADSPEILSHDCLHDAVNFLSLPTEEQNSVVNESQE